MVNMDTSDSLYVPVTKRERNNKNKKQKRIRKLSQKWTTKQTERLIAEVQRREALWNHHKNDYKDRVLRQELWKDVADTLNLPRSEVTTKWNSVRSTFRAAYTKLLSTNEPGKPNPPNEFYIALKFLEPTLRSKAGRSFSCSSRSLNTPNANETAMTTSNSVVSISEAEADAEAEEEADHDADEHMNYELSMPMLSTSSSCGAKRRKCDKPDDEYTQVIERALQTLDKATTSDIWDVIGHFLATNGRLWTVTNPKLARQFKTTLYKLLAEYQEKAE